VGGASQFARRLLIGQQTFHAQPQQGRGDGIFQLRQQYQQMRGALFEAKHADKFEGRNYVAGVHHRKARFIRVEGFGASFGQKQFTAEHDVEIGALQQARELFLGNRVTAEQK